MSTFLAPHNDDETLFAAYTLQRERPHVIVCTRAYGDYRRRERETQEAVYRLTGSETYEQWTFDAHAPDWAKMQDAIAGLAGETVWAPAYNYVENGHAVGVPPPVGWGVLQHDTVGWLTEQVLENVRHYCLYTRWNGRDTRGAGVEPSAMEIARKLEAVSQYISQIENPATRPWFYDRFDMREWVL